MAAPAGTLHTRGTRIARSCCSPRQRRCGSDEYTTPRRLRTTCPRRRRIGTGRGLSARPAAALARRAAAAYLAVAVAARGSSWVAKAALLSARNPHNRCPDCSSRTPRPVLRRRSPHPIASSTSRCTTHRAGALEAPAGAQASARHSTRESRCSAAGGRQRRAAPHRCPSM